MIKRDLWEIGFEQRAALPPSTTTPVKPRAMGFVFAVLSLIALAALIRVVRSRERSR